MGALREDPWVILVVPVFMALAGLIVNRLAVWGLFHPLRYVGVRPFGWQGYLPAHAGPITERLVAAIVQRVGTIRDVYRAMDPDRIAEHLVSSLRTRLPELLEDVIIDVAPDVWDRLDARTDREIAAIVDAKLPAVAKALLADIDTELDDLVDLDYLARVLLAEDTPLLNGLFREVGSKAFVFLNNVGFFTGLASGIAMLGVWILLPYGWLLPIMGLVTAAIANQVSRTAVFGWSTPRQLGMWRLQGVLYRDQERGSRVAVRRFTRDVVTVRNIVRTTLEGPNGQRARELIRSHVAPVIREAMTPALPVLTASRTPAEVDRITDELVDRAIDEALEPLDSPAFNRERQVAIEGLFLNRILDLTAREYEDLVRPAIRGAEWLLVLVGALGGLTGGLASWALLAVMS